ncbi:MAG: tetratricopeptide repeat-containing protein kinase family protein, partial [Steroidobacter sp.]
QIANVVAAAHDVGVLHKDIKPANVLITLNDDSNWHIQLTDFGSARVLDPQRISDLGITQMGLTMTVAVNGDDNTGTLLYLAPELLAHQAPTIQSDVYALGIILYQLVVGDLRKPMVSGWERDIEDELLRDDIRAATEGNPTHRLSSVHALIDRLQALDERRQLAQQEYQAELIANQTRDALRRTQARRPWVIAAGFLLLAGLTTSSWLYIRAIHVQQQLLQAKAQTQQQAIGAQTVTAFLGNDVIGAADPFNGAATQQRTVKEAMTNAVDNIDGKFTHDPITEASLRMVLGDIFMHMADGAAAENQWQRAVAVLTPAGSAALPSLLQSHYGLAQALMQQLKPDKAATELANADRLRLQYGIDDPQTQLISHESWGEYFWLMQQFNQAIPHFEQALQLLSKQLTSNLREMDGVRISLGDCYISVNRLSDAERLLGSLVNEIEQRHNKSELMLARAREMYGQTFLYEHRYQLAEPLIEQSYKTIADTLGPTNQLTLDTMGVRCDLYSATRQFDKALPCGQALYTMARTKWGDKNWMTLSFLVGTGVTQYYLHHYAAAIRVFDSARTGLADSAGPHNVMTQAADYYSARALLQLHQLGRVQNLVQSLDVRVLEKYEPGAPWDMRLQILRGMTFLANGKRDEARQLLQHNMQLRDDADPTDTILREARQTFANRD